MSGNVPYTQGVTSSKRHFKFSQNSWISGGVDYHFNWQGGEVLVKWITEARKALNQCLELAVKMAQQFAPNPGDPGQYPYATGRLQKSIRKQRLELDLSAGVLSGVFGSFNVRYAIWQEIGYNRGGKFYPGRHYIRRAGDVAIQAFQGYFRTAGGVLGGSE